MIIIDERTQPDDQQPTAPALEQPSLAGIGPLHGPALPRGVTVEPAPPGQRITPDCYLLRTLARAGF